MVGAVGTELAQCAARLGVIDALVFRRSVVDGWALGGGIGLGAAWSGSVVVTDLEVTAAGAPTEVGGVQRIWHREAGQLLGPFYTHSGAVVRVGSDAIVVFGNPRTWLAQDASDEALGWLAGALDEAVAVGECHRDADQLKVERAVRAVTGSSRADVWSILAHAADVAASALGCEVAIVRDAAGRIGATSTWGSIDVCDLGVLNGALDELQVITGDGFACLQATQNHQLPDHLSWAQGTRSLLVVPIPGPLGGQLVVAHTLRSPRGFTELCKNIGQQLGDAIGIVAYAAILRESHHEVADSHALAA